MVVETAVWVGMLVVVQRVGLRGRLVPVVERVQLQGWAGLYPCQVEQLQVPREPLVLQQMADWLALGLWELPGVFQADAVWPARWPATTLYRKVLPRLLRFHHALLRHGHKVPDRLENQLN